MITLRRIVFVAVLIAFMLVAAVFAYLNPQPIALDLGLVRIESVSLAIAFAAVFACGWLFGLCSAALTLWRSGVDKRRLRKDLQYAEAEARSLRALTVQDE